MEATSLLAQAALDLLNWRRMRSVSRYGLIMIAEVKCLADILKFLDYLRENSIKFDVKQSRSDSLMVSFTVLFFALKLIFSTITSSIVTL
jgi:hypothetical protein